MGVFIDPQRGLRMPGLLRSDVDSHDILGCLAHDIFFCKSVTVRFRPLPRYSMLLQKKSFSASPLPLSSRGTAPLMT